MESSLYRQFNKYNINHINKILSKSDNWIKKIFKKAWGKNGVECNSLTPKEENLLNQAIRVFSQTLEQSDEKEIIQFQQNIKFKGEIENNFLEYFNREDTSLVLEIIDICKLENPYYYNTLAKLYKNEYTKLNEDIILTKKDAATLENVVYYIEKELKRRKIDKEIRKNLKENFLLNFDNKDISLVLEIIKNYEITNTYYYSTLVKIYGDEYNKLKEDVIITEKNFFALKNLILHIEKEIEILKEDEMIEKRNIEIRKKMYDNFFDYFDLEDRMLVLNIINRSKNEHEKYYTNLVKLYGEEFNTLNDNIIITKNNFSILENYVNYIEEQLQNLKRRSELKMSFLDYFEETDKDLVLKILEEYKRKNRAYFSTLIKLYGKNYNNLNNEAFVTVRDVSVIGKLKTQIEKDLVNLKIDFKVRNQLNQSFLDYFELEDKTLVIKIIDNYSKENGNYYSTLVKIYGDKYNKLTEKNVLTNRDLYIISCVKVQIDKRLLQRKKDIVEIKKEKVNNITKNKREEKSNYNEIQIESLAKHFNTTDEIIEEAVLELPSIERKCVRFYFGIGTRSFNTKEMKKILNMSEKDIMSNIKSGIITMGNIVRILKNKYNKQEVVVKVKVKPKAFKKQ